MGHAVPERELRTLLVESNDLHADAMRGTRSLLDDVADLRNDRRHDEVDREQVARWSMSRRSLLARLGVGGALAGVAGTGLGSALAGVLAAPVAADTALDQQILQTASSLEILAVATYGAALTLPFIKDGNKVVVAFAQTTMKQHDEHRAAFQAQTTKLGGKPQTAANPKYAPVVESAKPTLKSPGDVVKLAATLEEVATETYLSDLSQFTDPASRTLMASVMGVECQHLATLRAVDALLTGGAPQLIAIPTDVAKLPAAAGSVGFPMAFSDTDKASPPSEGAVK